MARAFASRFLLASAGLVLLAAARPGDKLPLVLRETFERGMARWTPSDPAAWRAAPGPRGKMLSLFTPSGYRPPLPSPKGIALLRDVTVSDFVLDARVQSTIADYDHRDMCLVFGYRDETHFYYVHLGKQADDHSNQIFLVDGGPRKRITTQTTAGTPWTDAWHRVRLVRRVSDGTIEVYFDDMSRPVMTAVDRTLTSGRIGVGSYDDTGNWDDITLQGVREPRRP